MKCASCGSDLKEGELFCGSCGIKVETNSEENILSNEQQMNNKKSATKENPFRDRQVGWHHVRVIGLAVMFVTIWMPWLSYASINFASNEIESFNGSLWELCTSYLSIGNILYMGIFGIVVSLVFSFMKKNILSIIFWLIGSAPFLLIISMGNRNVHFKTGAYVAMAGAFLVIVSVAMKRVESKAAKNNL